MNSTDPIADMLTRIRNANVGKHETVLVPVSKIKLAIADILVNEGFIEKYEIVEQDKIKMMNISLKYGPNGEKVIRGLRRVSKPGLRNYANADEIPSVMNGLGIAIVSTNKGVITDKQARKENLGGEVLAYIW